MEPERATPLLRVADVAKSAAGYRDNLGFEIDPFPDHPPHVFAILNRGAAEIMLRKSHVGRPALTNLSLNFGSGTRTRLTSGFCGRNGIIKQRRSAEMHGQLGADLRWSGCRRVSSQRAK